MEYIIASLVAILIATLIVYKLANNILGLGLRLKPLLLCAVCAMLISLVLPKIVVGFAGLPGTIAVLAVFAVIFAYFVAKYEDDSSLQECAAEAEAACCLAEEQNESGMLNQIHSEDDRNTLETANYENAREADIKTPETTTGKDDESIVHGQSLPVVDRELDILAIAPELGPVIDDNNGVKDNSAVRDALVVTTVTALPGPGAVEPVAAEELININELEEQVSNKSVSVEQVFQPGTTLPEEQVVEQELQKDEIMDIRTSIGHEAGEDPVSAFEEIVAPADMTLSEESQAEAVPLAELAIKEISSSDAYNGDNLIEEQKIPEYELPADKAEDLEEIAAEPFEQTAASAELLLSGELLNVDKPAINNDLQELPEKTPQIMDSGKKDRQESAEVEQAFVQEAENSTMMLYEQLPEFESEDLDDLLEHAFVCKERNDYSTAFQAFSRALVLYPNSEAAPFLVVEIGNILKSRGSYDEAIEVLSNGRSLSQSRQDEIMEQEFISAIAYLRITKNVLLQNRLGNIRFSDIPAPVVQQIDEEFKEWRNVGNL
ncbi:hypothetical protein [Sporomusa aerivorans]|uniref:tetratricopeptide repeat protein n=1 Tax=Sporomusa aerivorans TaxID=204936 RepID=UPI00352A0174